MQTSLSKQHERGKMAMTEANGVCCSDNLLPILYELWRTD